MLNWNAVLGEFFGWALVIGIPLVFIGILIGPLWYFRRKHGKFTLKNVLASLLISAVLLVIYITAVYWGIAWLQGLAFLGIYGDKPL